MKQSRAACTSDDTVNVYQADTQEIFKLVAWMCSGTAISWCTFGL